MWLKTEQIWELVIITPTARFVNIQDTDYAHAPFPTHSGLGKIFKSHDALWW